MAKFIIFINMSLGSTIDVQCSKEINIDVVTIFKIFNVSDGQMLFDELEFYKR